MITAKAFRHLDCHVRHYPAGPAPRAVCLVAPSAAAGPFVGVGGAMDELAELQRYDDLGRSLAAEGIATYIVEMPPAGTPAPAGPTAEAVVRLRRILALLLYAACELPGAPRVLVARDEAAHCAAALLRAKRPDQGGVTGLVMVLAGPPPPPPPGRRVAVVAGFDVLLPTVLAAAAALGEPY